MVETPRNQLQELHTDVESDGALLVGGDDRTAATSKHHMTPTTEGVGLDQQGSGSIGTSSSEKHAGEQEQSAAAKTRCSGSKLGHTNIARSNHQRWIHLDRVWVFSLVIVAVGACVSCAFLLIGLKGAKDQDTTDFESGAQDFISSIEVAWSDFEVAGQYVHNACRAKPNPSAVYLERGICSRDEFDDLYKNVNASGLDVQAVCWAVNATHEDRGDLEDESKEYYANWTSFNYSGSFIGFEPDPDSPRGVSVGPSPVKDYYYAVHYCAPYTGYNLNALDFDIRTSPPRKAAVENALTTRKPALTDRVVLLGDVASIDGYSVILMHPGITEEQPNEVSLVVVRVRSLLIRAARTQARRATVVLFDTSDPQDEAHFLGGLDVQVGEAQDGELLYTYTAETTIDAVRSSASLLWEDSVDVADRQWQILVTQEADPEITYVVIGAVIIFFACLCLAAWYFTNARREARINTMKAVSESEKAALILENAEKAAAHERELNDFVAHEVRNPLAAAISAFSFVSAAVNEDPPLATEKSVVSVREDLCIIGSSLQYMNDLLRNMLDMHKAASNELHVELTPTDLQRDVLDTVAGMLYNRGDNVDIQVECPDHLAVMTDRIRLKQIILNLSNNSRKFVSKGFIRVRADVIDGKVHMFVEDSGPGIPLAKRRKLWDKYQESLDSLNQGTGIGLSLCQDLIHLMNGDIWLDEEYDSGITGCPGARFVVNLNAAPLELNTAALDRYEEKLVGGADNRGAAKRGTACLDRLPLKMKVLFVDDDLVLRKLFGRSVKRILPDWDIHEAANGETALEMTKSQEFDLIFVDQYMASIEKQLLGTETVRALRANGIETIVCGLSANDVEEPFLNAGANCFMFKPFPCEKNELAQELTRVLQGTVYLVDE